MDTRILSFIAVAGLLASGIAAAAVPIAPADSPQTPSDVTVVGQRLKLEARITNFVYGITALQNDEGVARWQAPVCPLVAGLARQQGEFVLERVSEIARLTGVPLGEEHCRPNLFIFVTSEPKELLQAMEKRYFAQTFGNATPSEVDEFINTPRPVRVWHSPYWTLNGATPQVHGLPPSAQLLGGGLSFPPTFSTPGDLGPSRLMGIGSWKFGNVYVVADQGQLHGVSQGQFADYIAMVSLAEIKPNAHPGGDAHSILTLFTGTPQTAPAALSEWDQAFLKSLYGTRPQTMQPRALISRGMMDELVP